VVTMLCATICPRLAGPIAIGVLQKQSHPIYTNAPKPNRGLIRWNAQSRRSLRLLVRIQKFPGPPNSKLLSCFL